jgi:hypothetical protein
MKHRSVKLFFPSAFMKQRPTKLFFASASMKHAFADSFLAFASLNAGKAPPKNTLTTVMKAVINC